MPAAQSLENKPRASPRPLPPSADPRISSPRSGLRPGKALRAGTPAHCSACPHKRPKQCPCKAQKESAPTPSRMQNLCTRTGCAQPRISLLLRKGRVKREVNIYRKNGKRFPFSARVNLSGELISLPAPHGRHALSSFAGSSSACCNPTPLPLWLTCMQRMERREHAHPTGRG